MDFSKYITKKRVLVTFVGTIAYLFFGLEPEILVQVYTTFS